MPIPTVVPAVLFLLAQASAVRAPAPRPAPVQRFQFDDDHLSGELQRPDDRPVSGRPRAPRHPSLIEIPRSMVPAIVKSLEDL
jgi:hypothetical protein